MGVSPCTGSNAQLRNPHSPLRHIGRASIARIPATAGKGRRLKSPWNGWLSSSQGIKKNSNNEDLASNIENRLALILKYPLKIAPMGHFFMPLYGMQVVPNSLDYHVLLCPHETGQIARIQALHHRLHSHGGG